MKRPRKVNYTLPQYSFGGWLKKNLGTIGSVVGGIGALALTGGLAAPAVAGGLGATAAGASTAAAGAGATLAGGAGALAGTTAATAGLGATAAGSGLAGSLGAAALGSKIGGSIGGAVQQNEMVNEQNASLEKQRNLAMTNKANQQFMANNKFQPNVPTFCKGGKIKRMKKYPGGGINPLTPEALPIQLDTTIMDTMSPARSELMKYGDINNPQLFSDLKSLQQSGEDINPKLGTYFSVLKGDNTTATPYTTAFLDNINKNFGASSGVYYDPTSTSFNAVDKDRYPDKYTMLQKKYVQPSTNTSSVAGKRLQSSGSLGVGTKQYAQGGYAVDNRGLANSELEDQEVYRTPSGMMEQLSGPTHAEGGIPMNLPQGTEILGKNKIPGTNKSFKEYGAKLMRDYNKYTKILDNKPTGLARKTAERMLNNINDDYSNTMALQESLKGVHQMPDGSMMTNEDMEYAKGGWIQGVVNPAHKGYCTPMTKSTCTLHRKALARRFKSGDLSKHAEGDIVQDEQVQLQDWMLDPTKGWGTQNAMNPLISDMQRYWSNKVSTQPRSFNGEAVMGQIMDYAPIAYNLAQGIFNKPQNLKASDYYNPNENQATNLMANRRYNVNPELEANRNAQLNYIKALRQGAPSQAQYLGSIQNSQTARSRSDAEAISRKQNMDNSYMGEEAQMRANLGQQRAATNLNVQDINDRNKSAARSYIPTALSQLQQANQVNRLMKNMKKSDAQKAKLLQGMFRGYGFNKYFNQED